MTFFSVINCPEINSKSTNLIVFSHVNGNRNVHNEDEETEKELEGEVPAKPLKTENNMNARRWKWEVLDD